MTKQAADELAEGVALVVNAVVDPVKREVVSLVQELSRLKREVAELRVKLDAR